MSPLNDTASTSTSSALEAWTAALLGTCGASAYDGRVLAKVSPSADSAAARRMRAEVADNPRAKDARFIALALAAAADALEDAGLADSDAWERDTAACAVGCCMGAATAEIDAASVALRAAKRLSPFFVPRLLPNMAAGHVSMRHRLRGPLLAPATACAAGAHAVGDGFRLVQRGDADVAVCGGTESAMDKVAVAGFARLGALSRAEDPALASRPFHAQRDGFVMGEGAAILVLESLEHAARRGAPRVYAEVLGYGASADAHHVTASAPDGAGAELAMRRALRDAGRDAVDYLNAHATSTPAGDLAEARAASRVFAARDPRVLVTSTKGATGHLLGAAGAIEAAFAALSVFHGRAPPTRGLTPETLDPELRAMPGLRWFADDGGAGAGGVRTAMSTSFGFGGPNVSLVFGRVAFPDDPPR